jgi:hypothetical protein
MTKSEFQLLESLLDGRYLGQIKGETINTRWILPTVPAIVFPSRYRRDERILPIDAVHPADIRLLPICKNFQEYMRSICF